MDPEPTPRATPAVPPTAAVPTTAGPTSPVPPPPAPDAPPGGTYPPGGYVPPPAAYGPGPAVPRTYPAPIGWVIAAVILFWPTSIPALLASHRSARAAGAGDAATAYREAATARRWGIVSVCVGGALIVLSTIVAVLWALVVAVAVHDHRDDFGWPDRGGPSQIQPFDRSEGGGQAGPNRGSGPGQVLPGKPGSGQNGFGRGHGSGSGGSGSGGSGSGGSATPTPSPTRG